MTWLRITALKCWLSPYPCADILKSGRLGTLPIKTTRPWEQQVAPAGFWQAALIYNKAAIAPPEAGN
jgi:hypothetical protein